MKSIIPKNFLKDLSVFFIFNLIIGIFLFFFLFVFRIIDTNYFICSELNSYNYFFDFIFPESCDQSYYFDGFTKFSNVFLDNFNYQSRPLYILLVYLVNLLNSLIFDNYLFSLYFSIFLSQLLIVSLANYLIYASFFTGKNKYKNSKILISLIVMLSPLVKFGIFDPSHQLLTLLALSLNIYFISKKINIFNLKYSLIFGVLVLLHREFFVTYSALVLYNTYFEFKKVKILSKNYFYIAISAVPLIFYNIFLALFSSGGSYDANSEYWGQFVWIIYFFLGKKKYESEWHCVEIPENFICYLNDNIFTIYYLIVPFLLVISIILIKNYKLSFIGLETTIVVYLFWSFIGWYPPIRFSYYSFGNYLFILCILFFFSLESKLIKSIYLTSYITYTLFLNHWNYENIIMINSYIFLSAILFICFLVLLIIENKKPKNI